MKGRKTLGDEEWKGGRLGRHANRRMNMSRIDSALEFLPKLYSRMMESERMPDEWRDSVLIPIVKNKDDVQSYRGKQLISDTMKLWERVVELSVVEQPERQSAQVSDRDGLE